MASALTLPSVLLAVSTFNLGMLVPLLWSWIRYVRGGPRDSESERGRSVSKRDIREELLRDPVAMRMFTDDDTSEDVQRFLYLEAERRAMMRKRKQLTNNENDFFAPPRRRGPDPGFTGCPG